MADYGTEQNLRLAQQMLKQQGEINALRAERDALIDEVKILQQDLEEFGKAQKAWLQFRRERDALKAAVEDSSVARFAADVLTLVDDYSDKEQSVIARLPFLATFDQVCFEKYGLNTDRLAALAAPETPGDAPAPCPRCEGSMVEPGTEEEGDWDSAAMRHHPYTGEPCTACNGTGKAAGWLDQLAAGSLAAAREKFGPTFAPETPGDAEEATDGD